MATNDVFSSPRIVTDTQVAMTWGEAQPVLVSGNKVRRIAWGNDDYLLVYANALHLRKADGSLHVLSPVTLGDMTGEDWIVVRDN